MNRLLALICMWKGNSFYTKQCDQVGSVLVGEERHWSDTNSWLKSCVRLPKPIKYPSSWLPTRQGVRWSILIPAGRGWVLAKSIIQTFALCWSWMKSNELPINCKAEILNTIRHCQQKKMYKNRVPRELRKIPTWPKCRPTVVAAQCTVTEQKIMIIINLTEY